MMNSQGRDSISIDPTGEEYPGGCLSLESTARGSPEVGSQEWSLRVVTLSSPREGLVR